MMSKTDTIDEPTDDRMAAVTNSEIRSGLKGVVYADETLPHDCEYPYCDRPQSSRLRRPDGVYDTLCWRHRAKRGVYTVATNALVFSPFIIVSWLFAPPLFVISLAGAAVATLLTLVEDEP